MRRLLAAALLLVLPALAAAADGKEAETWSQWSRRFAEKLEREGRFDDAVDEWIAVARLEPGNVQPLSRAAVLAVETTTLRGGELQPKSKYANVAEALVREAAVMGQQQDPGFTYVLGRLRYAEQKWGPAWKLFKDAMEAGFDPVRSRYWLYCASINRGKMLVDAGRAYEATIELERLRRTQPGHPHEDLLLINLAAAHRDIQEPKVATDILEKLLQERPDLTDAHFLRGTVLEAEGRLEEAVKEYRETMFQSTSGSGGPLYRDSLLRIADIYGKELRWDEAEAAANQAQAVAKDEPRVLFALGNVAQGKGDLDKAMRYYRRVLFKLPEDRPTLIKLKQVLVQLGETADAEKVQAEIDRLAKTHSKELQGEELKPPTPFAPPR